MTGGGRVLDGRWARTLERRFWDLHSLTWDQLLGAPGHSAGISTVVEVIRSAGVEPGEVVVDAGCGTGNYALALARAGYDVLAIDSSPGMLYRARRKASREGLHVRFVRTDLATAVLGEGRAGAALCLGVLQTVPDPDGLVVKLARTLRSGGVLLVEVPVATTPREPPSPLSAAGRLVWQVKAVVARWARTMTVATVEGQLQREGLAVVETFPFHQKTVVHARRGRCSA